MSIFSKKDPEPVVTGIDVLRAATKSRGHKGGALKILARELNDVGVSIGTLEDFGNAKADLSVAQLQALTKQLFPFAEYDPVSGMLCAANKAEPKPLCAAGYDATPLDPETVTYPPRFNPKAPRPGPRLTVPVPQRSTSRPGWAGSFFPIEVRPADHKPKQPFVRARPEAYD